MAFLIYLTDLKSCAGFPWDGVAGHNKQYKKYYVLYYVHTHTKNALSISKIQI